MKKALSLLLATMMMISCIVSASAVETDCETIEMEATADNSVLDREKDMVLSEVREWALEDESQYFDIEKLDVNILKTSESDEFRSYTVRIECTKSLKARDVTELPFIQGMLEESEKCAVMNARAISEYDDFIAEVADTLDEVYTSTLDVVVRKPLTVRSEAFELYGLNGYDTMLYPIENFETPSAAEMKADGMQMVAELVERSEPQAETFISRASYSYDRELARDYALLYSSNADGCYDHGSTCGIDQHRPYWNNYKYPVSHNKNLWHSDCADYVSQALYCGGIPIESGKWEREKDANNNWAWTYVKGLKPYMINNGYWTKTTYANALAGHVVVKLFCNTCG